MTVSLLEAKANLEELLLKATAGESVVIALELQEFEVTLYMKGKLWQNGRILHTLIKARASPLVQNGVAIMYGSL